KQLSPEALSVYEKASEIADCYKQDDYRKIYDKYRIEEVLEIDAYTTNIYLFGSNKIDYTKTVDYYHQALNKYPNNIFILNRGRQLSSNFYFYEHNHAKLSSGNYPKETLDFFNEIYISKNFSTYQSYEALKKYATHFPENGYAYYLLGDFAYALEYYDAAKQHYQKAQELIPISLENAIAYLKVLSRLKKNEELLTKAEQLAEVYGENKHYLLAQAYHDEGHYGNMRVELEKISTIEPKHSFLFGKLENISNQSGKALDYFKKAYDKNPHNKNYIAAYFEMLTKVRPNDAINFYTSALLQIPLNEQLYHDVYTFLTESKEAQLALEINQKSVQDYPGSSWAWNNYAENLTAQKDYLNALEAIHKSFEIYKPYSWSVRKFVEIQNSINNNDERKLEKELLNLHSRYPEVEAIWDELIKLKKGDDEKIILWESAIAQLPTEIFPVISKRNLLTQNKKWGEAVDFLNGLKSNSLVNAHEISFQKAIVYILKSRNFKLNESEREYVQNNFDDYLKNGGYGGAYHQYLAELYMAANDNKKALYHTVNHLKYRPDNQSAHWDICTKFSTDKPDGITDFRELISRNPYNKTNLRNLINLEVKWGGSP